MPLPTSGGGRRNLERRFFIILRQIGQQNYLRSRHPEDVLRKLGRHDSARRGSV